jgi:serine/threonine-protein kinase
MHRVARAAARKAKWDLLDDAADALFACDATWDRWSVQNEVRPWLAKLSGTAASRVALALRRHPDSARHFNELIHEATRLRLDGDIFGALQPAGRFP